MRRDERSDYLPRSVRAILRCATGLEHEALVLQSDEFGLLEHHGVVELALEVADGGNIDVREPLRERLIEANEELQHRSVAVEARAVWVCAEFERAGLDVRILKGVAAASIDHSYRESRVFKDVDLLVPPDELAGAVGILEAAGAKRAIPEPFAEYDLRFSKGVAMVCDDGIEVDLHRTFNVGAYGRRVDLCELWSSTEGFELAGSTIEALQAHHRVVHTLLHIGLSPHPKAIEMLDVRRVIERQDFDMQRLAETVDRWNVAPAAALAVRLTDVWLGGDWLPRVLVDWGRTHRTTRLEQWLVGGYIGPRASSPRRSAGLLVALDWSDRWRYGSGYAKRMIRRE